MLNLLIYARGRPQRGHRLCVRTLNFDFSPIITILHFLDKDRSPYLRKGIPNSESNARACSLELALVVIVTVIPRTLSTLS